MESEANYKERYVAFIDILGFQNSVLNIEKEPESYEKIITILSNISTINELRKEVRPHEDDADAVKEFEIKQDLRIQAFSDCVLISAKCNPLGLLAITAMSALTYRILFSHGFYARGAITKDLLTHSDNIVFGKGLVRAYSLEQKVAIYPRIILSKELTPDLSNKKLIIPVKIDFDGQAFLNVFESSTLKFIKTWNERHSNPQVHINLDNGRTELIKNLNKPNEAAIHQKLTWLKNYFNINAETLDLKEIE